VVGVVLDLAKLSSVRTAAAEVGRLYPTGMDVLINNAGIWASQTLTEDGIGETAQVLPIRYASPLHTCLLALLLYLASLLLLTLPCRRWRDSKKPVNM
jgi:NAD(P)-dependent dehydrogenase (short-subunit alcohol dehydrogenase family)